MNGINMVAGRGPQIDEVVIDEVKAQQNNYRVGDNIKTLGTKDYRIAGIYSPESGAREDVAQRRCRRHSKRKVSAHSFSETSKSRSASGGRAAEIDRELPGNTINRRATCLRVLKKSIPLLGVFLRVLVVLAAVVSSLVVMLAMYTTITERTREIGILKAMGASRGYIVGIIEKEAILISVIGLIAGFVVSLVAGFDSQNLRVGF